MSKSWHYTIGYVDLVSALIKYFDHNLTGIISRIRRLYSHDFYLITGFSRSILKNAENMKNNYKIKLT